MNRSTLSESMPATWCSTLTAALRFNTGCSASYTAPKPPSPSLRTNRYSPANRPTILAESRELSGDGVSDMRPGRHDTTPPPDAPNHSEGDSWTPRQVFEAARTVGLVLSRGH